MAQNPNQPKNIICVALKIISFIVWHINERETESVAGKIFEKTWKIFKIKLFKKINEYLSQNFNFFRSEYGCENDKYS